MDDYLQNKKYNHMVNQVLRMAPSIETLYVKSSNVGAKTGTLKNGVKIVKLQADSKRN